MTLTRRHMTVDGLRLSFLEQGSARAGAPSLVMMHGLMGSAEVFVQMLAELPETCHVIALDLPGAGRSERRAGLDATLPFKAKVTLRVIEELGLERPALMGYSHGGAVALQVAQSAPDRIGPLILLAPAHPFFTEANPLIRFYLTLPGRLFAYTLPWYPQWMQMIGLRRMSGPRSADTVEMLRPYRENLRTPGTMRHLLEILRTWQADMSQLRRLLRRRVAHPSLIVWGDCDTAVPLHSCAELRTHFELSDLHVLEQVGHRPAEERPEVVAALIAEFLERMQRWGWRYSPKDPATQSRMAALMRPSFESGD